MSSFFIFILLCLSILSQATSQLSSGCKFLQDTFGVTAKFRNKDVNLDELRIVSSTDGQRYDMETAAEEMLASGNFDKDQELYIWIHGWRTTFDKHKEVYEALIEIGKKNVYALDTSAYTGSINYLESSAYIKYIGYKLAETLVDLNEAGLANTKIHLIGHSIGAHIAGFAGKAFYEQQGVKIGRITGLDPAGPCFAKLPETCRLAPSDAIFVDVIHSNMGQLGMSLLTGAVDFFVNGGTYQSGCSINPSCSHGRAVEFFTESIRNPEAFPAAKADSWDHFRSLKSNSTDREIRYMGFHAKPEGATGSYHLRTSRSSLFSLGMLGAQWS